MPAVCGLLAFEYHIKSLYAQMWLSFWHCPPHSVGLSMLACQTITQQSGSRSPTKLPT